MKLPLASLTPVGSDPSLPYVRTVRRQHRIKLSASQAVSQRTLQGKKPVVRSFLRRQLPIKLSASVGPPFRTGEHFKLSASQAVSQHTLQGKEPLVYALLRQ
jgi:hypothetical protein